VRSKGGKNNKVMGKNLCGKTHKEWEARKKNKGCVILPLCQSLKLSFHLKGSRFFHSWFSKLLVAFHHTNYWWCLLLPNEWWKFKKGRLKHLISCIGVRHLISWTWLKHLISLIFKLLLEGKNLGCNFGIWWRLRDYLFTYKERFREFARKRRQIQ
jgi:hypothetical protein